MQVDVFGEMFCEYNRPKNETGLRAMSSIQVAMEGQVKWTPEAGVLAATGKPLRIPWSCRKLGVPFSDDGGQRAALLEQLRSFKECGRAKARNVDDSSVWTLEISRVDNNLFGRCKRMR